MSTNTQTIVGNLTADPEIRYIQSGDAVVNLTVADTPRVFNRETNQWEDDPNTLFLRCTMWRDVAENAAATLKKGMEVIVIGRLVSRKFESNGETRTVQELRVDHIGPSLRYMKGTMERVNRNNGGGQQRGGNSQQNGGNANQGNGQQRGPQGGGNVAASDEPPF